MSILKVARKKIERAGQSFAQYARKYANSSGSKKWQSLKSLNFSKGKYNNLDKEESAITEKFNEIF